MAHEAKNFDHLLGSLAESGHLIDGRRDSGVRTAPEIGAVAEAAREMEEGEVGHVVEADGVHTVFSLISYSPWTRDDFDRSRERVHRTLRNLHSEENLKALLERLEKKFGVERYVEHLRSADSG